VWIKPPFGKGGWEGFKRKDGSERKAKDRARGV